MNMDMGLGALMGGAIGGTWAAAKSLERQVGGYIPEDSVFVEMNLAVFGVVW